jgi:ABC-type transporter Mla subunit MlaD
MDQRANATGTRLASTSESVVKNMDALAQATQRAEGQMLGASASFREQLERIRGGLQGQIDDINRGLMQISAQLERTSTTLRSTTAGTVADVERISQRFDQTSKEAAIHLTDKTARMRGATEEVAKLLSGFGDQLDVLLDRLSMAGDGIRRHEGDLVGQMEKALGHLASVAERLESSRSLASNVSEQAVSRLTEVADGIKSQMESLSSGSQTAAGIMRGIGQIYGDQTVALNKGVGEAHNQVQVMNKSIDDMQARTDRMRVSLKLQGEELMNSLQQILAQLSTTGDTLSDTVDTVLQQQAADSLKKIG